MIPQSLGYIEIRIVRAAYPIQGRAVLLLQGIYVPDERDCLDDPDHARQLVEVSQILDFLEYSDKRLFQRNKCGHDCLLSQKTLMNISCHTSLYKSSYMF